MTYAKGTTVTVDRSQQEITQVLNRYGVETYAFGAEPGRASVAFTVNEVPIRIGIPLPPRPTTDKVRNAETGRMVQTMPKWEQDVRESWRALVLLLKAGLESVEREIATIDQVFMAFLVAPDGRTMGEIVLPAYHKALHSGRLELEA